MTIEDQGTVEPTLEACQVAPDDYHGTKPKMKPCLAVRWDKGRLSLFFSRVFLGPAEVIWYIIITCWR